MEPDGQKPNSPSSLRKLFSKISRRKEATNSSKKRTRFYSIDTEKTDLNPGEKDPEDDQKSNSTSYLSKFLRSANHRKKATSTSKKTQWTSINVDEIDLNPEDDQEPEDLLMPDFGSDEPINLFRERERERMKRERMKIEKEKKNLNLKNLNLKNLNLNLKNLKPIRNNQKICLKKLKITKILMA